MSAAVCVALALTACTPSSAESEAESGTNDVGALGISDDDYSLDRLVELAKEEGSLTVSDSTGKVKDIAENFEAKYGIDTTGVKMDAGDAQEVAIREAEESNVNKDLLVLGVAPSYSSVQCVRVRL